MKPLAQRQRGTSRVAGALVVAVMAVSILLPVPYVSVKPGPVFDLYDEADGQPVVAVSGATTYPTDGRLDMVVVLQEGGTTSLAIGSAVAGWLLPTRTVTPRNQIYPDGLDPDDGRELDRAQFAGSVSTALAAAADHLGRPVTSQVLVSAVVPEAPADGLLEAGDVITAVDGQQTSVPADVSDAVGAQEPGTELEIDYLRDGQASSATITSEAIDGQARIGLLLATEYSSDFEVEISLDGIGGPSAGLAFALAIVDTMTPDSLLGGVHVGATGTISPDGTVGMVSGVGKKSVSVADGGAGLFLVPKDTCDELSVLAPDGLTVAAVDSLSTAIDSITAWRSGEGELPTCT